MPRTFQNVSHRRRTGVMGTNTWQRAALDWTPLSLHISDRHRLSRISAPPPSPDITGGPHVAGQPAPLC